MHSELKVKVVKRTFFSETHIELKINSTHLELKIKVFQHTGSENPLSSAFLVIYQEASIFSYIPELIPSISASFIHPLKTDSKPVFASSQP